MAVVDATATGRWQYRALVRAELGGSLGSGSFGDGTFGSPSAEPRVTATARWEAFGVVTSVRVAEWATVAGLLAVTAGGTWAAAALNAPHVREPRVAVVAGVRELVLA